MKNIQKETILNIEYKPEVTAAADMAAQFMNELNEIERAEMIGFIRGARFAKMNTDQTDSRTA